MEIWHLQRNRTTSKGHFKYLILDFLCGNYWVAREKRQKQILILSDIGDHLYTKFHSTHFLTVSCENKHAVFEQNSCAIKKKKLCSMNRSKMHAPI